MTLDKALVADLEAIVGAEHVRTDRGDVEPYARDATPVFRAVPDAVVWPADTEQVAALLRLATERRGAGGPGGGGSHPCAATAPARGGTARLPTPANRVPQIRSGEPLAPGGA